MVDFSDVGFQGGDSAVYVLFKIHHPVILDVSVFNLLCHRVVCQVGRGIFDTGLRQILNHQAVFVPQGKKAGRQNREANQQVNSKIFSLFRMRFPSGKLYAEKAELITAIYGASRRGKVSELWTF